MLLLGYEISAGCVALVAFFATGWALEDSLDPKQNVGHACPTHNPDSAGVLALPLENWAACSTLAFSARAGTRK